MRALFDTSVAIAIRDGDPVVIDRAERLPTVALLSVLSVVELEAGVARGAIGREQRRAALDAIYDILDILPFGLKEAEAYSAIIEEIGFSRPLIIDRMIAAQAIMADAVLTTLNPRDFRGIPGLKLEDWTSHLR